MLTGVEVSLIPTDDADADWTEPDTNYGSDPYLYAESRTTAGPRVSYVKFDLSSIPEGSTINSASHNIYVYGRLFLNYLFLGTVENSWDEDTLTWNNKPGRSTDIGNVYVSPLDQWYSWDVTSQVTNALPSSEISFDMVLEDGDGVIFLSQPNFCNIYFFKKHNFEAQFSLLLDRMKTRMIIHYCIYQVLNGLNILWNN